MRIRTATERDLPGAYRVCSQTADPVGGPPAWTDPELIGHIYVGPYFFGPRTVALVLLDDHGVAGYCLGARDTDELDRWARAAWWPPLAGDYPLAGERPPAEQELVEYLHRPPVVPREVVDRFPAHLHIDLLPRAQGAGHGRRLIAELDRRLADQDARGVHLAVGADNANAIAFYRHLGFEVLRRDPGVWYLGRAVGSAGTSAP